MKLARKTLALAVVAALASPLSSRADDLDAAVDRMFRDLNTTGNYTAPGAFRGQVFDTYSGGTLMIRTPNKTYRLLAMDLPEAHGGCGGIDAFGGAFSHISSAELKNMLRNVTSALPGVAFQLALESVSPLLGSVSSKFHQLAEMANNTNKTTCAVATSLVRSAAEATNFSTNKACQDIAVSLGIASDYADAEARCKTDKTSIIDSGRKSPDPAISGKAPFVGNLTWKALQLADIRIDDQEREMIMSMVGTVIFYGDGRDPNPVPPTLTSISRLLYGQSDAGDGKVTQPILRCNNYASCDDVTVDEKYIHTPFTVKVEKLMRSISDKIRARTAIPNNSPEIGFVNLTSEPVYRMLSASTVGKSRDLSDSMIARFRDVIAADYAHIFLKGNVLLGMHALEKDFQLDPQQREKAKQIQQRAQVMIAQLANEKSLLYQKVGTANTVASESERLERQMRSNFSQYLQGMLGRTKSSPR